MLLGFPGRLIFLELLVHATDAPVLLAVAKSCNFLQYANQEINLCPRGVPGFTVEAQMIVAMAVAEAFSSSFREN